MGKRKFTAEFKARLVLEVISGERELGEIASEHQINPNQLRAWKSAFLEKVRGSGFGKGGDAQDNRAADAGAGLPDEAGAREKQRGVSSAAMSGNR